MAFATAPKKINNTNAIEPFGSRFFRLDAGVAVDAGDAGIDEARHAARPRDVDQTTPQPDLAVIASFPEVQRRKHAGKARMNGR